MLVAILLLTNLATTLFMTGLIWFVQIVHYAMFVDVGENFFTAYHQKHMARTTWIVAPIMIADPSKIKAALNWKPVHDDLSEIVRSAFEWERRFNA